MKAKKLHYSEQYRIAEKFITYNTNDDIIPLNYKMTSQTWAEIITKWSGVEVSTEVVIEVCDELDIERKEICDGVYVFAMTVSKQI